MGKLKFLKINSMEPVVKYLVGTINQKLGENKKVLWLVPGGSAIQIAAKVSQKLDNQKASNLTVGLTDERYGEKNHPNSNWRQLAEAGFNLGAAKRLEVLSGKDLINTAKDYTQALYKVLSEVDFKIALAGMGPDGHILGIKPGSSSINGVNLVAGYKWDDFERITLTEQALKKLDEVVIYAMGEAKHSQLSDLDKTIDPNIQAAQLLKDLNKVVIYNDYKGDLK